MRRGTGKERGWGGVLLRLVVGVWWASVGTEMGLGWNGVGWNMKFWGRDSGLEVEYSREIKDSIECLLLWNSPVLRDQLGDFDLSGS